MINQSILLLVLFGICVSCSTTKHTFPAENWQKTSLASSGLDPVKLNDALAYLKSKSAQDGNSQVLIIKDGKIVFEGDSTLKSHTIYSCSKAFTSTVLGLLIDENRVKLDDYAYLYEPSLKEHYPKLTLRHFASMTSGYSADGESRWNKENSDWSLTPFTPEKPHFEPGTQFEYWDEAQMMFGKVLSNILKTSMKTYISEKLTDPIGMGKWQWETEPNGEGQNINNGCTGVQVNAHQLARFGLLFLHKGQWNGKQVISKKWCEMATSMQVDTNIPLFDGERKSMQGSGSYGFNWWVNSTNGLSNMPDAPLKTAYLSGLNHNVCCIIPEWNMVIVRLGTDKNPKEPKHIVWNQFIKMIGSAQANPKPSY